MPFRLLHFLLLLYPSQGIHTVYEGWRDGHNKYNGSSSDMQAQHIPIHKPTCDNLRVLDQVEFGVHENIPVSHRRPETKYSFEEIRMPYSFGLESVSTVADPGCTPTTAICVSARKGWATHFAHSVSRLIPCFQVFRRLHSNLKWVVVLPGVEADRATMSSWNKELLEVTKMEVRDNATGPECKVTSTIHWVPGNYNFMGMGPLQLHSYLGLSGRISGESADRFKVGVLNRAATRHWSEASAFIDIASHEFPHAEFEEAYFDNFSLMEQAHWVNKQDIIITPHGAQETNLLFARRCMGVIELSPENYYIPEWFASLANALGAHFYAGYPERRDGHDDTQGTWDCCRWASRSADVFASANSVLTFLKQAVAQQTRCFREGVDV